MPFAPNGHRWVVQTATFWESDPLRPAGVDRDTATKGMTRSLSALDEAPVAYPRALLRRNVHDNRPM
jgi:hypothetical protein